MADEANGSRCYGQCCRSFRLSWSPQTFQRRGVSGLSGDEFNVAAMVIPLGFFKVGAVLPTGELSSGGWYYDCKNLQPNGDCGIYEDRPAMCRNFPNGTACSRINCTYTETGCRPTPTTSDSVN